MKLIFRFDDVSKNTNMDNLNALAMIAQDHGLLPLYCVSLFSQHRNDGMVFNPINKAYSTINRFYACDDFFARNTLPMDGLEKDLKILVASHGLFHVDHRLLSRDAQEMSIIGSCVYLNSRTFVPPFNKWNNDTVDICRENDFNLIRFEDGWLSAEHNPYMKGFKYYCHSRLWTKETFSSWMSRDTDSPST
jgi:hypothetical protein